MESIFRAFGKCHLESLSVFPDETNASCYNACLRRILTMEIKVIGEISREEQEKCIEEIKAKNPDKEASPATLSERSTASTTPRRPR